MKVASSPLFSMTRLLIATGEASRSLTHQEHFCESGPIFLCQSTHQNRLGCNLFDFYGLFVSSLLVRKKKKKTVVCTMQTTSKARIFTYTVINKNQERVVYSFIPFLFLKYSISLINMSKDSPPLFDVLFIVIQIKLLWNRVSALHTLQLILKIQSPLDYYVSEFNLEISINARAFIFLSFPCSEGASLQ